MIETFNAFVTKINGFVWGPVMLILLVGTHVYLTFRTRIIQRKTITAIKLSVTPDSEASGDVSGFGALATALAATIGTGNIVLQLQSAQAVPVLYSGCGLQVCLVWQQNSVKQHWR